jgi:hypothetical protein
VDAGWEAYAFRHRSHHPIRVLLSGELNAVLPAHSPTNVSFSSSLFRSFTMLHTREFTVAPLRSISKPLLTIIRIGPVAQSLNRLAFVVSDTAIQVYWLWPESLGDNTTSPAYALFFVTVFVALEHSGTSRNRLVTWHMLDLFT